MPECCKQFVAGGLILLLSLLLSGCQSQEPSNDFDGSTTNLPASMDESSASALTTTPVVLDTSGALIVGAADIEISDDAVSFLANASRMTAVARGIAQVHEVPENYVSVAFEKYRRLANLRKLKSYLKVHYTISIPASESNSPSLIQSVQEVALRVTTTTMRNAVRETTADSMTAISVRWYISTTTEMATDTTTIAVSKTSTSTPEHALTTTPSLSTIQGTTTATGMESTSTTNISSSTSL